MRRIMIFGATSAIAEAVARILVERGDALYLVGRNPSRIQAIAEDLGVRVGKPVAFEAVDANDLARHAGMLDRAEEALGGLDTVLIAHGTLLDQTSCQGSVERTLAEIQTNALSVVALLTLAANRFEVRRSGTLAAITSVAGDRGRASNYVYGSAKAMVIAFLSGLRQRLARSGVAVVTIEPGFVDTPMTAAFRKGFLWASPERAAAAIVRAMDRGTPRAYVPWFWRWIMLVIIHIPERLFARLRL